MKYLYTFGYESIRRNKQTELSYTVRIILLYYNNILAFVSSVRARRKTSRRVVVLQLLSRHGRVRSKGLLFFFTALPPALLLVSYPAARARKIDRRPPRNESLAVPRLPYRI